MARPTYPLRAIVLRKTKLKEKDLIVTLLAEDGSLVSAVAKGARRPGGSFSGRAELFCTIDALLSRGKSLDVLCDARLVKKYSCLDGSVETTACLAPIAELLTAVAQSGLEQRRLFDLAQATFDVIANSNQENRPLLCACGLWKIVAQGGFLPRLDSCAVCNEPLLNAKTYQFSVEEGGFVCENCAPSVSTFNISADLHQWLMAALGSRYEALSESQCSSAIALAMINMADEWIAYHLGKRLKSLDFLKFTGLD